MPKGDTGPGAESVLDFVSCNAPGTCTAFGQAQTDYGFTTVGTFLTESRGGWKATNAPAPPGASDFSSYGVLLQPEGLTCGAGYCLAAELEQFNDSSGGPSPTSHSVFLSERSGHPWSVDQTPSPDGSQSALAQVGALACAGASSCTAAGDYLDVYGNQQGALWTTTATGWSPTETKSPAGAGFPTGALALQAVSCVSRVACTAVGEMENYATGGFAVSAAVATLENGAWKTTFVPLPSDAGVPQLPLSEAFSCSSAHACAGSSTYGATDGVDGLVVSRSGAEWRASKAPLPAGAGIGRQSVYLAGIVCKGADSCLAAGSYLDSAGRRRALLLSESAGVWKATVPPAPRGVQEAELDAVACATPRSCTALGDNGAEKLFALTESSGSWRVADVPTPKGAKDEPFHYWDDDTLSCPAAGHCVGIGGYYPPDDRSPVFIATESGNRWSSIEAPQVGNVYKNNDSSPDISSITCTSRSSCEAFGVYSDTAGYGAGELLSLSRVALVGRAGPAPAEQAPPDRDPRVVDVMPADRLVRDIGDVRRWCPGRGRRWRGLVHEHPTGPASLPVRGALVGDEGARPRRRAGARAHRLPRRDLVPVGGVLRGGRRLRRRQRRTARHDRDALALSRRAETSPKTSDPRRCWQCGALRGCLTGIETAVLPLEEAVECPARRIGAFLGEVGDSRRR